MHQERRLFSFIHTRLGLQLSGVHASAPKGCVAILHFWPGSALSRRVTTRLLLSATSRSTPAPTHRPETFPRVWWPANRAVPQRNNSLISQRHLASHHIPSRCIRSAADACGPSPFTSAG